MPEKPAQAPVRPGAANRVFLAQTELRASVTTVSYRV